MLDKILDTTTIIWFAATLFIDLDSVDLITLLAITAGALALTFRIIYIVVTYDGKEQD